MNNITRFAPSPTGKAHVGNIRTALFDYLAARATNGSFFLRIEDTDRERFVPEAVDYIHEALLWLGLNYNGEAVYQSNHLSVYREFANILIKKNSAYKCFCSTERLDELKAKQVKNGAPPVYDRHCLNLPTEELKAKKLEDKSFVVRFRIPEKQQEICWDDKVRDRVCIATETLEDFIIQKSDGWPTYNFANVIDDHEQNINLVIRGEEFVPSTPKHILIYQALGWDYPGYAHIPLTLGSDKQKLSKRHGDTAIMDYKSKGYLPEAMVNFLVLLGWNPGAGSTEEIYSIRDLTKIFRIEDVNKAPAVFDQNRLDWMNGVWIRKLSVSELAKRLIEFNPYLKKVDLVLLEKIVTIEQSRLKTLAEFAGISAFYFKLSKYVPGVLIFKKSSLGATKKGLAASVAVLGELNWDNIEVTEFEDILKTIVEDNSLSNADVFWPVRVALSGLDRSSSPAELLWVLGKDESIDRLNKAYKSLEKG